MKQIIKEILLLFILVIFSNIIVEFIAEGTILIKNPIKFFGVALGVSIIGGFITHWVKSKQNTPE
jgi:hypothetical protein